MSHSAYPTKDDDTWYGCSNLSWSFMFREIEAAVSQEHKAIVSKVREASYEYEEISWEDAAKMADALDTIKEQGAGDFSNPVDLVPLAEVFRRAATIKSPVSFG